MPPSARGVRHDLAISRAIGLPSDYGHLELPESRDGYASAVIRRGPDETVAWQVLPPDGDGDAWVAVSLQGDDTVAANSWSGWLVELDVTTGNETARHFTK